VKTLASRAAFAAVAISVALAVANAPASARRGEPDPFASPTPAPLYDLASPPPTVNAAAAADVCGDDVLLSYRAVPAPIEHEVTVCGLVTSGANAQPPLGRGAAPTAFYVDVDGSQPIAVASEGAAVTAQPGDIVVVRGRYHRENGGGEGIDNVRTAGGNRRWTFDGYVMVNGTVYK